MMVWDYVWYGTYLQFQAPKLNVKTELDDMSSLLRRPFFTKHQKFTLPKTNSQSPWNPWWQRETIKLLLGVYLFSRAFAVSFRECISQNLSPKETPLTDHMVGYVGANSLGSCNLVHLTGQIIATSHDLGPQKVAEKEKSMEIRLFHGNLGWWNISIWPEFESCKSASQPGAKKKPTVEQLLREIQVRQQQHMEKNQGPNSQRPFFIKWNLLKFKFYIHIWEFWVPCKFGNIYIQYIYIYMFFYI